MKTKISRLAFLLLGVALAVGVVGPVRADEGDIAVGSTLMLKIRVPADGKTVQERVDEVNERLPVILGEKKIKPSDIKAVPVDKKKDANINIMVKKHLLITVTLEDGKANGQSVKQQADEWVKSLRKNLPKVNAKPNENLQNGK